MMSCFHFYLHFLSYQWDWVLSLSIWFPSSVNCLLKIFCPYFCCFLFHVALFLFFSRSISISISYLRILNIFCTNPLTVIYVFQYFLPVCDSLFPFPNRWNVDKLQSFPFLIFKIFFTVLCFDVKQIFSHICFWNLCSCVVGDMDPVSFFAWTIKCPSIK